MSDDRTETMDQGAGTETLAAETAEGVGASGRVSITRIFWVFFRLGALSWGGGSTLSVMMLEECTERQRWMTLTQYNAMAGISRVSPGMNLVAMTVLIGLRLGGAPGIAAALAGLTIPSLAVIMAVCAFFQGSPRSLALQGALHGVNGVVVGLLLAAGWRSAQELSREAPRLRVLNGALVALSAAASLALGLGPLQVIALCGAVAFCSAWLPARRAQ